MNGYCPTHNCEMTGIGSLVFCPRCEIPEPAIPTVKEAVSAPVQVATNSYGLYDSYAVVPAGFDTNPNPNMNYTLRNVYPTFDWADKAANNVQGDCDIVQVRGMHRVRWERCKYTQLEQSVHSFHIYRSSYSYVLSGLVEARIKTVMMEIRRLTTGGTHRHTITQP